MKKLHKNSIILFIAVTIISLNVAQFTRAGIIEVFFNSIGITSENREQNDNYESIEKSVEENLDSRQKEVVSEIVNIYGYIQNMDIDAISDSIDYKLPKQTVANVKEFFENYENGFDNAKYIAGTLKYKIESVTNIGDKVIAKITYTYPAISKVIKKVLPKIVLKNAGIIFGGDITNDTLDSALGSIKNELQKNTYEVETYTREFTFENINNKWKLTGVDAIVRDLTKYINEIGNDIF